MAKKVFHIKFCTPHFKNGGISNGFIKNGWDVVEFDWMEAKRIRGVQRMRQIAIREAHEPALIFIQCQTAGNFDVDTIEKLQEIAPTVIFNIDARIPEETEWLYQLNEVCCHVFYSNGNDVAECAKRGITNCSVLQSSCDEDEYMFHGETVLRETRDIVFIGNKTERFPLSKQRTEMVEALYNEFGDEIFGAYGMGWKEGFVLVEREMELYSNAKVIICQNQFPYEGYDSDRIWRAMVIGKNTVRRNDFEDTESFIDEVRRSLSWSKEEDEQMEVYIRNNFLNNHTYTHRIAQATEVLKEKYGLIF